jgi:hypothetical protein
MDPAKDPGLDLPKMQIAVDPPRVDGGKQPAKRRAAAPAEPELPTPDSREEPPIEASSMVEPQPETLVSPTPPAKPLIDQVHEKMATTLKGMQDGTRSVALMAGSIPILPQFRIERHPVSDVPRVGVLFEAMVYATVTVEKGDKLVLRLYAHLPALANNVVQALLKECGIQFDVSTDSFIRPSFV